VSDAPADLVAVGKLVDQRLERVFDEQRNIWAAVDPRLIEAVDELSRITMGGKRLRAGFCYWAWLGAGGGEQIGDLDHSLIIDVCASFELLQAFALIHDDIMDDADTRRGEPTIHVEQARRLEAEDWKGEPRRYGEGVAILVGDLSHVYADQLIGNASAQTRQLWDQLRIELNLGQYLDMRSAASGEFDRATAQRVATFKSALYTIVRPLQLGATIAGPMSDELLEQLDHFGRPAGQAFQLRDDLLGVLGDEHRVGKPVGNDLREGKPTELVAVAVERASETDRRILDNIGRPELSADQAAAIIDLLQRTGAVAEIERRIDELVQTATSVAHDLPFAFGVRETLIVFANYVAARQL
jgi:geranylgeranyl diphosphate synthase type I